MKMLDVRGYAPGYSVHTVSPALVPVEDGQDTELGSDRKFCISSIDYHVRALLGVTQKTSVPLNRYYGQ